VVPSPLERDALSPKFFGLFSLCAFVNVFWGRLIAFFPLSSVEMGDKGDIAAQIFTPLALPFLCFFSLF